MREWLLTVGLCACGTACGEARRPDAAATPLAPRDTAIDPAGADPRDSASPIDPTEAVPRDAASPMADRGDAVPAHQAYPDLAAALVATIPADARVVGFGELHVRTDRAPVASSLVRFTGALPAIGAGVSDLVLETWITAPACGQAGVQATAKVETTVKRPEATKSEIAELVAAARAAGIQPHAMTLTCADYTAIAPPGRPLDPAQLLTITTRELTRIAISAVGHRDREAGHRPWIAVYGGALHNDRFPDAAVAEWSYAAAVDRATGGHFVEIDVIVPELAEADAVSKSEPWFALARAPRDPRSPVVVWKRGERSFVVVLPPA